MPVSPTVDNIVENMLHQVRLILTRDNSGSSSRLEQQSNNSSLGNGDCNSQLPFLPLQSLQLHLCSRLDTCTSGVVITTITVTVLI